MSGLGVLIVLAVAVLALLAYGFWQACKNAPMGCEVCGRDGCDGSLARCIERMR